jgi:RHS repeat-associated protein
MVTNTYDADQAYKLTQKDTINSLDDVLQDISYNYDNVGNITQLVDSSENDLAKTLNYTYDDLYRLTVASSTLAVQGSNYHQTYSYDPIGNMTNKSDIGDYEYANTNPYQATEINNINQTYDANGNLTNDNNLIYNFNWQDRFASTTLDASTTLSMLYDYSGLRTMKQKAFDTIDTQFNPITFLNTTYYPTKLYEEELSSIQGSTSTPSSIEIRHIMFGNQTIANVKRTNYANPALTLVFSDHLGSSGIVTNSSGVLKSIYDYYPYGGERNTDETYGYATDYRFTGKELDEETNLSYFEQRYYNQGIGRFTQVDPLSFSVPVDYLLDPQQLNNYSYARNNPLTLIDPSGEKVYAVSKAIESQESGTHVFLYMVPDNPGDFGIEEGQGWIVGAYYEDENDSLKKQINAESDVSVIQNGYSDVNNKKGALKDKVEVPTPDGKTDTEFIKDIMVQYNAYQNDAAYDPFAVNGYNSNNFTTTLLVNAGVKNLSWNGNAPGIDPGYGDVMPSNYKRADGNSVPSGRGQNLSALGSYGSNRSGQNIGAKIKSATNSISNSISNGSKVIWNWLKGSKQ